MPSPGRLVRRCLTMLRNLGIADSDALTLIAAVALEAERRITGNGYDVGDWFQDIAQDAYNRLSSRHPSITDQTGDDHGDGTSGRTGRTAQHQDRTG